MNKTKCPINFYIDNLIFNEDKSVWAAFKLKGYDYDFLEDVSKISMLNRVTRLLCEVWSDAQILGIPVEQNNVEHFRKLRRNLRKTDPLYDLAFGHAEETQKYLQEFGADTGSNDYSFYMIVKLAENSEYEVINGIKEMGQFFLKNPLNSLNVLMNLDTGDILNSKLQECKKMARKYFDSLDKKVAMEKVHGEEMQWLFRRMNYRGLQESPGLFYKNQNFDTWVPRGEEINISGEDIIRPYHKDIAMLFSGAIRHKGRTIEIDHGKQTSYQTFLVVTQMPDKIEYPGTEWLYMLQQYNVKAEFCLRIKAVTHREGLKKLDNKKQEIDAQMENVEEANMRMPDDLETGANYADAMEAELKMLKAPILYTTISICLSADNQETLEDNVLTIKNAYEDIQYVIERPLAEQYKLFINHIPTCGNTLPSYVLPLSPMMLAGGVIGAVHELGDREGPYIGTTGAERKQVFLNMGQACLKNKSASATFYGNLGFGKSFNANLLLCLNVLYGGYGLIFDPKGERGHWEEEFDLFKGVITTVELSTDPKFKGKLDPFIMYRDDINMATDLAFNILMEQRQIRSSSPQETALKEALNQIKKEYQNGKKHASMTRLCEILKNFNSKDSLKDIAKDLARSIELDKEIGMSALLFGEGKEEGIKLDNRLNILMIQNLKLPSPTTKKEDYTAEERMATVIMMVLGHFAKQFALTKRDVFSMILFDESWALGKTTEGVKLIDFLTRMGRSLYTGVILNGHSVLDLPTEGIRNTISYKFCFHTDNYEEAGRMCDYIGIANTAENRDAFMSLKNAQCMFRDLDGHVGRLQFDAVFEDIIQAFSTTPVSYSVDEEEKDKAAERDVEFIGEEYEIDLFAREVIDE